MTAEPRVDQHSEQSVELRISLRLRHEGLQVQILWIFHILVGNKQLINIKQVLSFSWDMALDVRVTVPL